MCRGVGRDSRLNNSASRYGETLLLLFSTCLPDINTSGHVYNSRQSTRSSGSGRHTREWGDPNSQSYNSQNVNIQSVEYEIELQIPMGMFPEAPQILRFSQCRKPDRLQ